MRRPLIVGNWKTHCTSAAAQVLVSELVPLVDGVVGAETVLCPPFTSLNAVSTKVRNTPLRVGAQDVFWENEGAWTGEISPIMLSDFDCRYVIVGHSERRGRMESREGLTDTLRASFADNDDVVNRKLLAVLAAGMSPVCCVGETQAERDAGQADKIVADQVTSALRDVSPDDSHRLIFAFEPVWAIGTGNTCPPDEANRFCGIIRDTIRETSGEASAESTRILYGGGVTSENAEQIVSQTEIDGALIGGASLKATEFAAIVRIAARTASPDQS